MCVTELLGQDIKEKDPVTFIPSSRSNHKKRESNNLWIGKKEVVIITWVLLDFSFILFHNI